MQQKFSSKIKLKAFSYKHYIREFWHQQICTTRYVEESPSERKLYRHKGIKRVRNAGSVQTYFLILKFCRCDAIDYTHNNEL